MVKNTSENAIHPYEILSFIDVTLDIASIFANYDILLFGIFLY